MLELVFEMNESVSNLSPASLEMFISGSLKWGMVTEPDLQGNATQT